MSDIGFAKAGDAWRWRGRHAAKRQDRRETGSHAFAELAKLRRK
jgi:ATP-dependent RNA helicase SUPV3L1/SUV3